MRNKLARAIDHATLGGSALSAALNDNASGDNGPQPRLEWTREIHIEVRCRVSLAFIERRVNGTGHCRTQDHGEVPTVYDPSRVRELWPGPTGKLCATVPCPG